MDDRFERLYQYYLLQKKDTDEITLSITQKEIIKEVIHYLETNKKWTDIACFINILAQKYGISSKEIYGILYEIILGKNSGPKMETLRTNIGNENILKLLGGSIND